MSKTDSDILENLIRLLYRLREISCRDFSILSDEQFNWKSQPNKWSIAECFRHILLIYEYYLPLAFNVVENSEPDFSGNSVFKSGLLGKYLINTVKIREDNSIKKILRCPARLSPMQNRDINGEVLLNRFKEQTDSVILLLEKSKNINLASAKAGLPFFSYFRMRLGDFMSYFVFHVERHVVQAQKIYTEDNFPRHSSF